MAIAVLPETDALTLAELRRLARVFDTISDETGARYAASAFVDFVADELRAGEPGDSEGVATA